MEETNKKTASANDKHIIDWQKRMMPWLIIAPSALILIFILLATVQLRSFESHIYQSDSLNISKSLPKVD
jgi:hypothetical protein